MQDEGKEEITKKEHGGKGVKHSPHTRPNKSKALKPQTDPGDNMRYIEHSLKLAAFTRVNTKSPEEMQERIFQYFEIAAEDDMRPSVAGLALALGISRQRMNQIAYDENHPSCEVMRRAYQILEAHLNNYMLNGKINPVSGIFLLKNHFGYSDQKETIVISGNLLGPRKDIKELEQKYIDCVADDVD